MIDKTTAVHGTRMADVNTSPQFILLNRIATLEAENKCLRKALAPMKREAEQWDAINNGGVELPDKEFADDITVGECRRAREALKGEKL